MLSERERQVLEEMEREVSAADPRLAESLQATTAKRESRPDRWAYNAVIAIAWTVAAACLLLGLAGGVIAAGAVGALAFALRRRRFRNHSDEHAQPQDDSEGGNPQGHPGSV